MQCPIEPIGPRHACFCRFWFLCSGGWITGDWFLGLIILRNSHIITTYDWLVRTKDYKQVLLMYSTLPLTSTNVPTPVHVSSAWQFWTWPKKMTPMQTHSRSQYNPIKSKIRYYSINLASHLPLNFQIENLRPLMKMHIRNDMSRGPTVYCLN